MEKHKKRGEPKRMLAAPSSGPVRSGEDRIEGDTKTKGSVKGYRWKRGYQFFFPVTDVFNKHPGESGG